MASWAVHTPLGAGKSRNRTAAVRLPLWRRNAVVRPFDAARSLVFGAPLPAASAAWLSRRHRCLHRRSDSVRGVLGGVGQPFRCHPLQPGVGVPAAGARWVPATHECSRALGRPPAVSAGSAPKVPCGRWDRSWLCHHRVYPFRRRSAAGWRSVRSRVLRKRMPICASGREVRAAVPARCRRTSTVRDASWGPNATARTRGGVRMPRFWGAGAGEHDRGPGESAFVLHRASVFSGGARVEEPWLRQALRGVSLPVPLGGRASRSWGWEKNRGHLPRAIEETRRRREVQERFKREQGVEPRSIVKDIANPLVLLSNLGAATGVRAATRGGRRPPRAWSWGRRRNSATARRSGGRCRSRRREGGRGTVESSERRAHGALGRAATQHAVELYCPRGTG